MSEHLSDAPEKDQPLTELANTDNPKSIEGISITLTVIGSKTQPAHDYFYWDSFLKTPRKP
ncbi:MAG: hypothetical protein ACKVQS_01040 [Fimbriimonadaceae bacterium]